MRLTPFPYTTLFRSQHRLDLVCPHVGPTVPLRQELGAALRPVVVRLEERRQEPFAQLLRRVRPQGPDQSGGADNGTAVPALAGLRQFAQERSLLQRARADDPGRPHEPARTVVRLVELDPTVHEPRRPAFRLGHRLIESEEKITGYRR